MRLLGALLTTALVAVLLALAAMQLAGAYFAFALAVTCTLLGACVVRLGQLRTRDALEARLLQGLHAGRLDGLRDGPHDGPTGSTGPGSLP